MSLAASLAAVPVLIGMNAFFVAAEYAVVALRPAQIDALRADGWRKSAAAVEALKARPADAIGTIQVCITMTNLMLGWIGEPAMSALLRAAFRPLETWPPPVAATVPTILSFVVATLRPVGLSKLLPRRRPLSSPWAAASRTPWPLWGSRSAPARSSG